MSKLTQRKFLTQASRRNHQDTHFQMDPVNWTKERERTLGTKVVRRDYYLPVEVEETMITAVMKSQTKESCDILKVTEKLMCLQGTPFKSRLIIEKG